MLYAYDCRMRDFIWGTWMWSEIDYGKEKHMVDGLYVGSTGAVNGWVDNGPYLRRVGGCYKIWAKHMGMPKWGPVNGAR